MSTVVVDTNVVSFVFKDDTRAALYRTYLQGDVSLSFMTVAELYKWAETARWGLRKRTELAQYLRQFAIIWSNTEICLLWAQITAACEQRGRPISVEDAWIAACAIHFDAPLVTHNRKDFESVPNLRLISENI